MIANRRNARLTKDHKELIMQKHQEMTIPQMAIITGVSRQCIRSFCNHHDLDFKRCDPHAPRIKRHNHDMGDFFNVDLYMKANYFI